MVLGGPYNETPRAQCQLVQYYFAPPKPLFETHLHVARLYEDLARTISTEGGSRKGACSQLGKDKVQGPLGIVDTGFDLLMTITWQDSVESL